MRNKPLSLVFCLLSFCLAISACAETAFLKLPPPIYGGVVRDYLFYPYDATNAASVIVRRAADAKLLATAETFNPRQGVNYSVSIPMVSAPSEGVVGLRYGEAATFSFLADGVIWADLATVTPSEPGYCRLDVIIGHDENGDGIVDEYVAYIEAEMHVKYGLEGSYDPEADYNHDGVSNREHYLAGTYPFAGLTVGGEVIAEQKCTISSLMNVRSFSGSDYFAISFNALEEASYSVVALDDLAKGWGAATTVATREKLNAGLAETEHWAEETGEMTLYVLRDPKAKQGFYKLVVGSW